MWLLMDSNCETSKEKVVEQATPEEGLTELAKQRPPTREPEQLEHVYMSEHYEHPVMHSTQAGPLPAAEYAKLVLSWAMLCTS